MNSEESLRIASGALSENSRDTLRLTCYRSFDKVQALRPRWDAFVGRIGGDLYLSFDWCATWWRHFGYGRDLELYVANVRDELAGIFPLFRETIKWGPLRLRVVRLLGCDHLTTPCNIAVDPAWMKPAAQMLLSELDRNGRWDLIHFGELAGYCEHASHFAEALRCCEQSGKVVFGDNDYPHMVFELPADFEQFLASLSLKERRNVRHDQRQLQEQGAVYRQPACREDFEQAMSRLVRLHTEQWAVRGRLGHFREWPGAEAFHREIGDVLSDSNRLALVEVCVGDEVVASEYGGRFGPRMHWIIGARRDELSSRVGFCALVRSVVCEGVRQIDALPGYYDYKRRLGARVLGVKNIFVLPRRFGSRLRLRTVRAVVWLAHQFYFRLWFWHLAPWLRSKAPWLRLAVIYKGMWPRFIRAHFLLNLRRRASPADGRPDGGSDAPEPS